MDSFCKSVRETETPYDCLLFDLDDTLYSAKLGIAETCRKNIDEFLIEKCGFSENKASSLRVELFKKYGSSLAGLRVKTFSFHLSINSFVHGKLPYQLIKPDSQLRNLLRSITQRKIIFTNSDRNHAIEVLKRLGVDDCFDQIICFETMNPNISKSSRPDEYPVVLKPSPTAMKIALDVVGFDPRRTLFLDDNPRNVAAGKAVGFCTVLVGKTTKSKESDYVLETVNNLAQIVPEIWVSRVDGGDQKSRSGSEIKSALAAPPVGA
ncbi:uncharacterized protein LOC131152429 isoform X2 [Malania oleifera]|uniref:uncharacterized protein LOC131152429 isoform X2 n=1 Tax=Malania oleifera TaxID=397392 RepID=UPI0025AE1E0D|nr:uncharacterized protein LOC131152429 isoform X2 [Malania oleifera]